MSELTREQVIEQYKSECALYVNGHCDTLGCLRRGGYVIGDDKRYPTCAAKEAVEADTLTARLQESEKAAYDVAGTIDHLKAQLATVEQESRDTLAKHLETISRQSIQLTTAQQTIDAHDGIKTQLEIKIQELTSELSALRQSKPRLVWTTEKPMTAGWYFYHEPGNSEYVFAVNDKLNVMLPSVPHPLDNCSQITGVPVAMFNGEWAGPIPAPLALGGTEGGNEK